MSSSTTSWLRFEKMQGLGNDFLVVDDRRGPERDWSALAPALCDRRTGVGADGILLIQNSDVATLRMVVANADGSTPEMCGNGIRCAAVFAAAAGMAGDRIAWETGAGVLTTERRGELVAVGMGEPRFTPAEIPVALAGSDAIDVPLMVDGETVRVSCVGMGNPHCVVEVPDLAGAPVATLGARLEQHPLFPHRANVSFVQRLSTVAIEQRTFERGVGVTMACGTAACASVVTLHRRGLVSDEVAVHLPGGVLTIRWPGVGTVLMTGPAVSVFRGEVEVPA